MPLFYLKNATLSLQTQKIQKICFVLLLLIGTMLLPLKGICRESEPESEVAAESATEDPAIESESLSPDPSSESRVPAPGKWSYDISENESGIVEIEPTYLVKKSEGYGYELASFQRRRAKWGTQIGIGYSLYRPKDYSADLVQGNFEEVYDGGKAALVELEILVKRNIGFGSIGGEIGIGTYKASSHPDFPELTLELTQIRVGMRMELKTWGQEPYIVPYVSGGGYILVFKEVQASSSFGGSTLVAPYFIAGVQFQLNWLDQASADSGFRDSGLENTYFYAEGRFYADSSEVRDPNFKSDLHPGVGLKLEF